MLEKLKSRKFWMGLFGAALPIINAFAQGRNPNQQDIMISVAAVCAYIVAEGFADGMGGTVE
jgi:hypothetical protein